MKRKGKTAAFAAASAAAMILLTGVTGCSGQNQSWTNQAGGQTDDGVKAGTAASRTESTDRTFAKKAEISLSEEIKIEGSGAELLENHVIFISEGGEYVFTGALEEGMIYIDTSEAVELTLNGAAIHHSDGPAILGQDSAAIYINSVDGTENEFSDGETYEIGEDGNAIGKGTIFSNDDLYFIGEGSLTVTGSYKHAIKSDDSIVVESGELTLSAAKDGLNANDTLTVNGGTITVSLAEEGLEGETLIINDGTVSVTANDDCLNAGTKLSINGGIVYAVSSIGDAVDSNGSLEINGGFLAAYGASGPEGGLDCDANEISISGGTVIATGGTNSLPDSGNTQYSVLLGAAQKGDTLGILDAEGNTVFAYEAEFSYSNMILSIPDIKAGETYAVYTGGSISGGTERFGCYEDGVYEGGTKAQEFTADVMVISAGGTAGMGGRGGFGDVPAMGGMHGKGEWTEGEEGFKGMPEGREGFEGMPEGREGFEGMPEGGERPEGMIEEGEGFEGMPEGGERPGRMQGDREKPEGAQESGEMTKEAI